MITNEEIYEALREVVKKSAPELYITSEQMQDSKSSYAWINLKPAKTSEGFGVFNRRIMADIAVVLSPTEFANVDRSELYKIADALDENLIDKLKVKDRFITLKDTSSRIFDGVLTYSVELQFADYSGKKLAEETGELELMKELSIRRKDEK